MELSFFDSNCMIGRWPEYPRFKNITNAKELLAEMDYYSIDKALVSHAVARKYDQILGNKLLTEEIQGSGRLYCSWVLGGDGADEAREEILRENNVKGIHLYPEVHEGYVFSEWVVRDLFTQLDELKMPTFLHLANPPVDLLTKIGETFYEFMQSFYWDKIIELAQKYPNIPLILCRMGYHYRTMLQKLFEEVNNVYLELSNYHPFMGIEDMVSKYGAERFLFGTYLPFQDPGQSLSVLTYAEINEEEKNMIAGKNLKRLIKGVRNE